MAIKHEAELYAPLKAFFEMNGYEVKGEVRHCDLVGMKEGLEEPLIVELKKTFNLALLLQGIERLKLTPYVYLAVEKSRAKKGAVNQRWNELSGLCGRLGLGLITVTFYKTKAPFVEVLCEPEMAVQTGRTAIRRKERLLYEFRERSGDYNTGGITRAKLVTAYREKTLRVAAAMNSAEAEQRSLHELQEQEHGLQAGRAAAALPGISPAAVRDRSGVGSAADILQRNYYGWFRRVSRGRYVLTPAGIQALADYATVLKS
ncbi:hypothetical protein C7121_13545 [Paenibacillus glucanolyticus]|uniref:Uncharacterized protein n=1 Tax=Paenibacillus glucanolyticus TaxID=59843 RepID=A0A163FK21_9BACL|nr:MULTISPECIES: DUF2161 family putative PD-(D/E)XK-type phosphodiesterase [Paenibacillus]ANA79030.1 hypothetical protein A3958_02975 [Paenibacillus glucanolyticus]AVV57054.1 hypothetical protein C7121_13545 [Paenibacillus glucanolyticus]AWP26196.1 hypothetical protein B9D94_06075 [Paenibacillus sp. Cedars]ETT39410.1 hypothetical protein C169_10028 [Paenibacillus sp. FSL R5-808]KZS44433.1 hypothetical protein AWU65_30710 [Paenibacillus glucanolyticus]